MPSEKEEKYYNISSGYLSYKSEIDSYLDDSHSNYNAYCKTIIHLSLENNLDYIRPCVAFLKYTDNLKRRVTPFENTMPCEYVNIWLKEQIKKISNAKYNASEFFKTLNSHDLSKSFVNGLCEKEINDIDDSLYNNFQFLHNLYYNLNKYENIAITDDLDNCVAANQCAESYEREEDAKEELERTEGDRSLQERPAPRGEETSEFTPLGSFLRPWIEEKEKRLRNSYKYDDYLLYNSEKEETDTKNIRYNIQ
ncbi:PIR Superfamily Protein [Plasmodium ovale curtisi]|uniref:PIR Superfamily Protein n=1 Tax=Plasmodium ovale curtisi TaxID=864141 RepID=A0A1A8WPF2_PLAOA|nr:PIR Superfamily Protein [Plasmodium ovale curtisi]